MSANTITKVYEYTLHIEVSDSCLWQTTGQTRSLFRITHRFLITYWLSVMIRAYILKRLRISYMQKFEILHDLRNHQ